MKLLAVLLVVFNCFLAEGFYSNYYMSNHCGSSSSTSVSYAVILKAGNSFGTGYPPGTCVMTLRASDFGSRLIIKFKSLDLFSSDRLELFDGSSTFSPKLGTTMSGVDSSFDDGYRTSGRYLTVRLYSRSGDSNSDGFEAIVTEFHTSSCLSYEFSCCGKGDCIDASLKDDDEYNCLDNSDEWDVSGCLNTGAVAGITVGVVIGAIIVFTLLAVFCCRMCRARRVPARAAVATVTTATTYSTSQQIGAYPVQQAAYPQQMSTYPPQQAYHPQQPPAAGFAPPPYNVVTQPERS